MGEPRKTFRVSVLEGGRYFRRRVLVGGLFAALLAPAADAGAARVRGSVTGYQFLLNPVWEEGKEPDKHGFSFREPVPTVRAEFRRLFPHIPKELCVALLAATPQQAQKPIGVRVGGGRSTPVTIVVTPGTQLQFQNTDPFPHRLYGVGIPTFNASDTVKAGTRTWQVPAPGTFEVRDEAAPSLRMFVIAEPNLVAIAYPSMKGEFSLNAEAPGEYHVQAFFAGKKVGPEVPVKVGNADVDLSKAPLKVGQENKADKDKEKAN